MGETIQIVVAVNNFFKNVLEKGTKNRVTSMGESLKLRAAGQLFVPVTCSPRGEELSEWESALHEEEIIMKHSSFCLMYYGKQRYFEVLDVKALIFSHVHPHLECEQNFSALWVCEYQTRCDDILVAITEMPPF